MKFSASCSSLPHRSLAGLAGSHHIHLVQGSLAGAGTVSGPRGVKKKKQCFRIRECRQHPGATEIFTQNLLQVLKSNATRIFLNKKNVTILIATY